MGRKWIGGVVALLLAVGLLGVLPAPVAQAATITWDGGAGTGNWNDANNWSTNTVPGASDEVILDNSVVTGSYTVTLPAGATTVSVKKLTITPSSGNTITLVLPSSNTAAPGLIVGDNTSGTDDLIINNGGILQNSSGATTSTTGVEVNSMSNGTFRINNGGRYIHNTLRANTDLVARLSTDTGTELGVFEFDVPGTASYAIGASGRTYGSLVLTRTAGSATYTASGASLLTVRGNFTINSGVTFSNSMTANMQVAGNWVNHGTFAMTSSTPAVVFNGSGAQTIGGSASTSFNNLTINNSSPDSAGVILGIGQTVNGTLTLTDGLVKIGSYNLTLGPNATVSGGSDGSMIVTDTDGSATGDGFVCKQYAAGTHDPAAFTFPVGDYYGTTQYSPAVLDFGSSTFDSNAQVCVRVTNAQHPSWPGSDYPTYINRYWTVTQSNITSFTCDTTFTYREDGTGDDVVIGSGQSEAALYHKIWNGSSWTTGNQANTTANTFGSTVNSFSDHTAFSGSPLAVSLAAFTADVAPAGVALTWETVSEADNAGFRVLRSEAADGERVLLAFVPAAAPGSTAGANYRYVDATAEPGRTYWYWLEDVDLSGATTLHGPISVTYAEPTALRLAGFRGMPSVAVPFVVTTSVVLAALAAAAARRRQRNRNATE